MGSIVFWNRAWGIGLLYANGKASIPSNSYESSGNFASVPSMLHSDAADVAWRVESNASHSSSPKPSASGTKDTTAGVDAYQSPLDIRTGDILSESEPRRWHDQFLQLEAEIKQLSVTTPTYSGFSVEPTYFQDRFLNDLLELEMAVPTLGFPFSTDTYFPTITL